MFLDDNQTPTRREVTKMQTVPIAKQLATARSNCPQRQMRQRQRQRSPAHRDYSDEDDDDADDDEDGTAADADEARSH